MAHYLFEREYLKYNFVREVTADVNSEGFDQRALETEGVHYDATRDTVVVVADSKEQAEQLLNT
jgi:hypothetical protein